MSLKKQVICHCKVFQMKHYRSVTLMLVQKTQLQGRNWNNFHRNPNCHSKKIREWLSQKQIEAIHIWNGFDDKSAKTDCSKEMLVPILKGLKHLNTVLGASVIKYCSHKFPNSSMKMFSPKMILYVITNFHETYKKIRRDIMSTQRFKFLFC